MLRILYGVSATALDAFRAGHNPVDHELVADLERVVERTRREIERLAVLLEVLSEPKSGALDIGGGEP
jgi:hypothetical protein